jgi:hypothetical protein
MVSLSRPNSPQVIYVELKEDFTPPVPPNVCSGPFEAYLLHYDTTFPTCIRSRCQDSQEQFIIIEVYFTGCFTAKAGEFWKAEKFKDCGKECSDGQYVLRWNPPPTIIGKTKIDIPGYSETCPGVGTVDRIKLVDDGMGNFCDETQTQVITVFNPCMQEVPIDSRIHASLVDEEACTYEISLVCCPEEGEPPIAVGTFTLS